MGKHIFATSRYVSRKCDFDTKAISLNELEDVEDRKGKSGIVAVVVVVVAD